MRPISWLAERRQDRILSHACPHLDDGEKVLHWVRARRADRRGEGFVYLTPSKWVVHWVGKPESAAAVEWSEMDSWGLAGEDSGPTVLGIEAEDRDFYVELPAASEQVAAKVRDFLRCFAELAPPSRHRRLRRSRDFRAIEAGHEVDVTPEKRSPARHIRMVVATVVGAALLITGIALLFLPGPGFLLVIAGFALLSTEYDWAKDALSWAQDKYRAGRQRRVRAREK